VVSQRLVPSIEGGRAAAVEIMLNTQHVSELIEQGDLSAIKDAIEKSMAPGSQTFEQALLQLLRDGRISQEEALANADSATNLYWLINNEQPGKKAAPPSEPEPAEGATFTEFTLNV